MRSFGLLLGSALCSALPVVVITGAGGQTGSILYGMLKASDQIAEVRALVLNATAARDVLHCNKCDESEGIYEGDVSKPETLTAAFKGADTVAIAVGVSPKAPMSVQEAVEFKGVENSAAALAQSSNLMKFGLTKLRAILVSSMGTTNIDPPSYTGGSVLFWKLNAENFLGSSGITSVIVKPCGLANNPGNEKTLVVGHDDELSVFHTIGRSDVASVAMEAIVSRAGPLKFDLCSQKGDVNTPADALKAAKFSWQ